MKDPTPAADKADKDKADKDKADNKENTAYTYRLYPTAGQIVLFRKTFGCCRKVWNLMLADRQAQYAATGKSVQPTPAKYKKDYPYLKEVDSMALCNVQMSQQRAFTSFFEGRTGFPKFHSRKRGPRSYTTNCISGNIVVGTDSIRLPKVGAVKAVIHREAPADWKLKSATVRENADGTWQVSVLYEHAPLQDSSPAPAGSHIGLDYKSDGLYVNSGGRCAQMPHFFRKSQKKLAREQRRLSRRQGARKGETPSKNYLKQKKKVAKVHRHTANQRKDFLHKESAAITKQYELISVEDLNMRGMARGLRLGKSVHDNGWGMFVNMLEYKQSRLGHQLVKVDRFFPSSQLCSVCGTKNPAVKNLDVREWDCPHCGTHHDRDVNAAINIDREGLRITRTP